MANIRCIAIFCEAKEGSVDQITLLLTIWSLGLIVAEGELEFGIQFAF